MHTQRVSPKPRAAVRSVVMLAFPGVQILDVVGALEVFNIASRLLHHNRSQLGYATEIVAKYSGTLETSGGIEIVAKRSFASPCNAIDTLMVGGGVGVSDAAGDRTTIKWIKTTAKTARRVASVCTGALLLAEAGLLDGRRATTHWSFAGELAERFPYVTVDPDPVYICDGNIYSSAGVSAGMDLALALVEADHGRELALEVARWMVLFLKRPGGQSQFSSQLATQISAREPIRDLQTWILEHPGEDLSVEALAGRSAMSPRNFARVFSREVGLTPARFVENVRVEAARRDLEESSAGVEDIALRRGFGSSETMRRAFLRTLRVAPSDYRHRFQSTSSSNGD